MRAEISFDTVMTDYEDWHVMEGCFRFPDGNWTVFYITRWWEDEPKTERDHKFASGVKGVRVDHPKDQPLTKRVVRNILSDMLGVTEWQEATGPDSLTIK